jgi:hypothetical protein
MGDGHQGSGYFVGTDGVVRPCDVNNLSEDVVAAIKRTYRDAAAKCLARVKTSEATIEASGDRLDDVTRERLIGEIAAARDLAALFSALAQQEIRL